MSEKQKRTLGRQSRNNLLLPIVIACAALLASCGGGSDSTSTAESADGTKEALAVSGATGVPPGWTGRAPKMEVINGIVVPPEPAPAVNNATLKGVDVNGNGVRDDVERRVATTAPSVASFDKSITYAARLQNILQMPTPSTKEEAQRLFLSPECAVNGQTAALAAINYAQLIFNTEERRAKIKAVSRLVPAMTAQEVSNYVCQ